MDRDTIDKCIYIYIYYIYYTMHTIYTILYTYTIYKYIKYIYFFENCRLGGINERSKKLFILSSKTLPKN